MSRKAVSLAILVLLLTSMAAFPVAVRGAGEERRPLIVFDNSHGQYYDSERLGYFISDLRKLASVYINSRNPLSSDLLSNATILILTNPKAPLTDEEVAAIRGFVEKGGVLIVMGDWYRYINDEALNKLTAPAGIRFTKTSVWDKQHYDYRYYFPLIRVKTGSELGDYLASRVKKPIKYSGCYLELNGSAKAFLVTWNTAVAYNPDKKVAKGGAMPVGAYAKVGEGYIIAIGGSRVAYTSHFYGDTTLGNRELMLAIVTWAFKKAGIQVLPVKITIDTSPWMLPVGEESSVVVNVTVEALGDNLANLTLKVSSEILSGEKKIEELRNGETFTTSFSGVAKPAAPGQIPITIEVSSSIGKQSYTRYLYAVKEGGGVIFDYSHGEYYWLSRVSGFAESLSKYGTVAASKRPIDEALKYAKILVLLNPSEKFTYTEASSIRDWVKNGGILIVFGDYYAHLNPVVLNMVTSPAGINWLDGSVHDKQHSVRGRDYLVYLSVFPDNTIAKAASKGVDKVFYSGTSLRLSGDALPVLVGHDTTFTVDKDGNVLANGTSVVTVAAAKLGKGFIVAVGGVATVLDSYYGVDAYSVNRKFFENLLEIIALGVPAPNPTPTPPAKVYVPHLQARLSVEARKLLVGEKYVAELLIANIGNGSAKNLMVDFTGSGLEFSSDGETWNRTLVVKLGDLAPEKQVKVKVYYKATAAGPASLRAIILGENIDPAILKADLEAKAPPSTPGVPLALGVGVAIAVAAAIAVLVLKKRPGKAKRK